MTAVLHDLESSTLDDKYKALLRFVEKVNHNSSKSTAADMLRLYQVGCDDEAIYYAIAVCARFNSYNGRIDATGVHPLCDEAHREGGKCTALHGYVWK